MDDGFWGSKRVLITGHTGFKGSWLSSWLQNKGAHVIGYSLPPPTNPNLFDLARVGDGMTSIIGNILDLDHLTATFTTHRPDVVFHLAAQPLVHYAYTHPVETYATNVLGTVHVLEAIRHSDSVRVLVDITSDKCYENNEWHWGYRENDTLGGCDPYSSSKACAELVLSAYRQSYFNGNGSKETFIASARAGNVIGGGDWASDRLVPDIMRALLDNRPVVIRNPRAIRPWQHVLEPLSGYLLLAERLWHDGNRFAGAWNFGPGDDSAQPVSWVVDRLLNLWGRDSQWELDSADHPHEAAYLKLDCSKARQVLRWSPRLNLSTALHWIVKWYSAYVQNRSMRQVVDEEILRYEAL